MGGTRYSFTVLGRHGTNCTNRNERTRVYGKSVLGKVVGSTKAYASYLEFLEAQAHWLVLPDGVQSTSMLSRLASSALGSVSLNSPSLNSALAFSPWTATDKGSVRE